jgi:hypothetical protein
VPGPVNSLSPRKQPAGKGNKKPTAKANNKPAGKAKNKGPGSIPSQDLRHTSVQTDVEFTFSKSQSDERIKTAKCEESVPDGYAKALVKVPALPLGHRYAHKLHIENELLCFLQNQTDTLGYDYVINICSDLYDSATIRKAKIVLFEVLQPKDTRLRLRRKEGKAKVDIADMIDLLLATELMNMPIFVARDLSNLPPLSTDNCDMSALLHDLESVKCQIRQLTESQRDIVKVVQAADWWKTEPATHRTSHTTTTASPVDNTTPSLHIQPLQQSSILQEKQSADDSDHDADDSIDNMQQADDQADLVGSISEAAVEDETSNALITAAPPSYKQVASRVFSNTKLSKSKHSPLPHGNKPITVAPRDDRQQYPGQAGHQSGQKPYHNQVVVGTSSQTTLRSSRHIEANQTGNNGSSSICTGISVTRLASGTISKTMEAHIRNAAGLNLKAEQLRTRFEGYSSFHVCANANERSYLLNPDIWPRQTMLKPFFERQ